MIYEREEIMRRIAPVAHQYVIRRVYLFGSYARGEARRDSDIDILVDDENVPGGLFRWSGMWADFQEALGKDIDMVALRALEQPTTFQSTLDFREEVRKEMVRIYGED